jgi:hypothetical protein
VSIAGDLLVAASAARLFQSGGSWTLAVVRLVAVEQNVYVPRTRKVQGHDAILKYLKQTANDPALAAAASRLFRACASDDDCFFEAVEGEWVACNAGTARESTRPGGEAGTSAEAAELRAELVLLRVSHDGLRERVARLEGLLASGRASSRELMPSLRLPSLSSLGDSEQHGPSGTPLDEGGQARTQVSGAARAEPENPPRPVEPNQKSVQERAAEAEARAAEERAAEERAAEARARQARMKLPTAAEVSACLGTLLGKKLGVTEERPVKFPPKGKHKLWFSRMVDDDNEEVGVIVSDLVATVGLGGGLLMLPPAELESQRAAEAPSDDVISAMDEVANNLSATINRHADGVHVRVQPLEMMAGGNLDWVASAPARLALDLEGNLGKLYLFAR